LPTELIERLEPGEVEPMPKLVPSKTNPAVSVKAVAPLFV